MSRPEILRFLETERFPVTPEHPAWGKPLPRKPGPGSGASAAAAYPTVGDYFGALEGFCRGEGRGLLAQLHHRAAAAEAPLEEIRIFLSRHGAFYHPARLVTRGGGCAGEWVVNVAYAAEARRMLERETAILSRLRAETGLPFLPEVCGCFAIAPPTGPPCSLWVGEWFSGFCEFHLHRADPGGTPRPVLWEEGGSRVELEPQAARAIYREAARILTLYLRLESFEEIALWHHAAGDFVVRPGAGGAEVRLTTVRDYRPLFGGSAGVGEGIAARLERLLLFFLALSLHTRLDRLDGTGDFVLAPEETVSATREGVLAALAAKSEGFPLAEAFAAFLASCNAEDLLDLCRAIVARRYVPGSPERLLLEAELPAHAAALHRAARQEAIPPR
ncbi:MAG: hypothetical protein WHT06_00045 [Desulfobacterales bacterium]